MVANTLMKILRNVLVLVLVVIVSYFLDELFHKIYVVLYQPSVGGLFYGYQKIGEYFVSMILAFLFFLFLLFTAFGDQHKKWWMGIAAIPALAFLLYFDLSHIYFHVLFPIAGWLIGWGIHRLLSGSTTK